MNWYFAPSNPASLAHYLIVVKCSYSSSCNISDPRQLGNASEEMVRVEGWGIVINISGSQYNSSECWRGASGVRSNWIYLSTL